MIGIAAVTVLLAFAFTFTNGFQDASSVAATLIASRSATPKQGIIMVASMAFLGAVMGGSAVAFTLSGLITIDSGVQTVFVLLAAITGATAWNLLTWRYGLPSSSTHALIGGLIGAAIAAAGIDSVFWGVTELTEMHEMAGVVKILFFFVASVGIGFAGSYLMHRTTSLLLRNADRSANRTIVRLNWAAASIMAFSNGANDSQKQLGIIALVLFAAGQSATLDVPLWARLGCAVLLAAGTLGGGWRIMKTLGRRIFEIEPIHSFDSQVFSGASIALSTLAGAPVSSTHVITTSVIGVGAAENPKKVHWPVGREIIAAMVVTIPVTMAIGAAVYLGISPFTGM
ncbi:inorganic phosphate transporter [Methanofollis fontis]|uniref:Inorganic phosphate transporter n=1 Tax=Methanofollis fontis TaxID=2052832 RepID=A0A483CW39_9EURY|nr:inorganic phosphate transporter [Methanofollis fontis]TAJ45767.1 inorganic phosphate transporter [Methanofollis fontis]